MLFCELSSTMLVEAIALIVALCVWKRLLSSIVFAFFMSRISKSHNSAIREQKMKLFSRLKAEAEKKSGREAFKVLEIGGGSGTNFEFFDGYSASAIEWTTTEPEKKHFSKYFNDNRSEFNNANFRIKSEMVACRAEDLDDFFDAYSFDAVVATLVFCSVQNPRIAISQIFRVLKPSGVFIFVDHVQAPKRTILRYTQNLLTESRLWPFFTQGCHLNRRAEDLRRLIQASADKVEVQVAKVKAFNAFMRLFQYHIFGVAFKDSP